MGPALRVLVLSHMYPRADEPIGGIFVHEQVQALRALGADVRVVSGMPSVIDPLRPATWLRNLRDGTRTGSWACFGDVPRVDFRFAMLRGLWPWLGSWRYEQVAEQVVSELADEFPFDVIHAHTSLVDGMAAARIGARFRRPIVLTEHTGPFSTLTRNTVMRRRTERAVAAADRVLPVSESLRKAMLAEIEIREPARLTVLGNGVDCERFRPRKTPKPAGARIQALWVGHLVAVKQVSLLLDAFARARRDEPRLHLRLIGSGPLERPLDEQIRRLGLSDAVERLPRADRDALAGHLRDADFLVLASAVETFGVIVGEAMATGLPVLSTRCGGPSDLIVSDELGSLVDGNVEALAEGIATLAKNHQRYDPARIRAHVLEHHDKMVVARKLLTIYQEAIDGS